HRRLDIYSAHAILRQLLYDSGLTVPQRQVEHGHLLAGLRDPAGHPRDQTRQPAIGVSSSRTLSASPATALRLSASSDVLVHLDTAPGAVCQCPFAVARQAVLPGTDPRNRPVLYVRFLAPARRLGILQHRNLRAELPRALPPQRQHSCQQLLL